MINLFGVVGADIKASEVMREIQAYQGDTIEVVINSVGGSVYEGMAIYGALKNDPRPVKTTILGIGASIASVIFMAGDEREISEGSQLMIHNALAPNAGGNKYEMAEAIERLERIDSDMKKIYSSVTGLQNDILEAMLEKETFLNADEALKLGFATSKAGAQELVAIYNEKQEETAMAELDKEEMSFLQGIFAKLGFGAKAESDVKSEPVAEVAMDEEEEKEMKAEEPAEVEAMEEYDEEEAEKAEDEEEEMKAEESEVDALKARISELETALEAKLDKEAEAKKQALVFEAIKDNKLTLAQGKDMIAMSVEDVEASLEEAKENSSGYGDQGSPEEIVNMHEQYKAISDPAERSAFYHANKAQIKKDKLK